MHQNDILHLPAVAGCGIVGLGGGEMLAARAAASTAGMSLIMDVASGGGWWWFDVRHWPAGLLCGASPDHR
ncbi:hypothetical protein [Lysobacter gummosus]|uniref:hypothetical protein n=1 Tax=Lysobacter gummosus TaxID=262324 RepID=UPI00363F6A14